LTPQSRKGEVMFHKELYNVDEDISKTLAHATEMQQAFLSSYQFSYQHHMFGSQDNMMADKTILSRLDSLPFLKDFFDTIDKVSEEKYISVRQPEEMFNVSVNVPDLKQVLTLYSNIPQHQSSIIFFDLDNDFKISLAQLVKIAQSNEEKRQQLNAGQIACLVHISLAVDANKSDTENKENGITKKLFSAERARYLKELSWHEKKYPDYLICFLVKPEHVDILHRVYHDCFKKTAPFVGLTRPAELGCHETSLRTLKAFATLIESNDTHRLYSVGYALNWLDHMGIATAERITSIMQYPDGAVLLDGVRWDEKINSFQAIKMLSECMYDILLPAIITKHNAMNAEQRMIFPIINLSKRNSLFSVTQSTSLVPSDESSKELRL
jgi:hypothetical protein